MAAALRVTLLTLWFRSGFSFMHVAALAGPMVCGPTLLQDRQTQPAKENHAHSASASFSLSDQRSSSGTRLLSFWVKGRSYNNNNNNFYL